MGNLRMAPMASITSEGSVAESTSAICGVTKGQHITPNAKVRQVGDAGCTAVNYIAGGGTESATSAEARVKTSASFTIGWKSPAVGRERRDDGSDTTAKERRERSGYVTGVIITGSVSEKGRVGGVVKSESTAGTR